MTEETRRLLGGYATGNLSAEERQLLFRESLTDSELFQALAEEQSLKELLDDPRARAQVLRAAEEPRFTLLGGIGRWLESGKAKALVATGVCLVVAIAVRSGWEQQSAPRHADRSAPSATAPVMIPTEPATPGPQAPARPPEQAKSKPPAGAEPALRKRSAASTSAAPVPPLPRREIQSADAELRQFTPPRAIVPNAPADALIREGPVAYAVQRRNPNGSFVNMSAADSLDTGTALRMQITAHDNGFIDVTAGPQRRLFAGYMKAGESITAPAGGDFVPQDGEEGVVTIAFTRMEAAAVSAMRPAAGLMYRDQKEAVQVDRAKPAVDSAPGSAPATAAGPKQNTITIRIPLRLAQKSERK